MTLREWERVSEHRQRRDDGAASAPQTGEESMQRVKGREGKDGNGQNQRGQVGVGVKMW